MPNTANHKKDLLPGSIPLLTIGVVADTHLPDRVRSLPASLLSGLRSAGVSAILHAGDITIQSVLDALAQIAPVTAVMGNRDWFIRPPLPMTQTIEFAGVKVGIAHGHGGWIPYLVEKGQQTVRGYHFERYHHHLLKLFPNARVIIFGHSHIPELRWENGILFFNPGGACPCPQNNYHSHYGLLHFYEGGEVEAEIISLPKGNGNQG